MLFSGVTQPLIPQSLWTPRAQSVLSSCDRLISLFCLHVLCANHFPPGNDCTAQWRVWAWSSCTERGPGRIYTQNYLACLSLPPSRSLQRRRGTTCHIGVEWHRWCTRCVAGARDGRVVWREPRAAAAYCLVAADDVYATLAPVSIRI